MVNDLDSLIFMKISNQQGKFIEDNFKLLAAFQVGKNKYYSFHGEGYSLVEERHISAELNFLIKRAKRDFFLHTFLLMTDGVSRTPVQSVPEQRQLLSDLMRFYPHKDIHSCLEREELKSKLSKELKSKNEPKPKVKKI